MEVAPKEYYKYLDTYRFIAVSFVILTHWLPTYFDNLPLSKIGVDMFFVLSGFLITEILIKQKKEYRNNQRTQWNIKSALLSFYARRTLRIFPIYYLTLLFFVLINARVILDQILYFLFYLTNYLIIAKGQWPGMFSHLWSLAVEEQFYLLWPFIILATPARYLKYVLIAAVFISLGYILVALYQQIPFFAFNTLSCISTLGGGALLALTKVKGNSIFTERKLDLYLLFVSVFLIMLRILNYLNNYFLFHVEVIIFSFVFIKILITRTNRFLDYIFANTYISFLGKISYGLYLYHSLIPWLLRNFTGTESSLKFIKKPFLKPVQGGVSLLLWHFFLLFLIAAISWYVIERPINNYKKHFKF